MSDIRLKFEEIWPVPEGVYWCESTSGYYADNQYDAFLMHEWNDRLDTFTRCQETTDVYVSLVEELVGQLEIEDQRLNDSADLIRQGKEMLALQEICQNPNPRREIIDRAKQIMEQKK